MKSRAAPLSWERLTEVLNYEPSTGLFRWKKRTSNRVAVGGVAGSLNPDGYIEIRVDGSLYLAHRLAFFYQTKSWPSEIVDHENLNRSDNRWDNLREATHSQNHANQTIPANNTSGFKGVVWYKRDQCWRAQIKVNGSMLHLGYFDDAEAASEAYNSAAIKYFGEFARAA